jgi:hypothetical protein
MADGSDGVNDPMPLAIQHSAMTRNVNRQP